MENATRALFLLPFFFFLAGGCEETENMEGFSCILSISKSPRIEGIWKKLKLLR
jgi:hypothetical protein